MDADATGPIIENVLGDTCAWSEVPPFSIVFTVTTLEGTAG